MNHVGNFSIMDIGLDLIGKIPIGIIVLFPIGNLTFTPTSFYNSFDEIKQTLVHVKSYSIEVCMTLDSYDFSIPTIFLSYESNRPLRFSCWKEQARK